MTTCPACDRAAMHPTTGHYTADCMSCEARAIAQGPEAYAREADPQALQALMRAVWVDVDAYKRGRVMVWNWLKKLTKETT